MLTLIAKYAGNLFYDALKKATTTTLCVSVQDRYLFDCGFHGYDIFSRLLPVAQ
jgi:hypothetical protein